MDVLGAQYGDFAEVDLQMSVSAFKARYVAAEKLDVRPSLVTLRLVRCGSRKPTAEEEAAAVELDDPSLSLGESGVTGTAWLLAFIAGVSAASFASPQSAPPAAEAFWLHLPKAEVDGQVLRLAGGTTFLGSSTLPGSMYIRDDYLGLWTEMQRLLSTGWTRIVVSGNPGIGKSWFGLYVAFRLMSESEPPTIVWEARRRSSRTLICRGKVLEGSLSDFRAELADTRTWYLVDEAIFPGATEVEARTLVFSSPKRENYRFTLKSTASTMRFLPVWSWEEIETCRQLLYANDPIRTPEAVEEAFMRWGGIPRYVLEKIGDEGANSELAEAISGSDLRLVLNSVGQIDTAPETSHRVLHISTCSPKYLKTGVGFGSDFIRLCVTKLLLSRQRAELAYFACHDDNPLFAKLRGDCFEAFAHDSLAAGGEFLVRELAPAGDEKTLRLSKVPVRRFSGNKPGDLAVLRSFLVSDYCQPLVGNFPVIDAVILPNTLLQMTVSLQHDVNEDTLKNILAALSLKTAELVFVVPKDKFYDFKASPFKDKSLRQRVTQKALCVSFDIVL